VHGGEIAINVYLNAVYADSMAEKETRVSIQMLILETWMDGPTGRHQPSYKQFGFCSPMS